MKSKSNFITVFIDGFGVEMHKDFLKEHDLEVGMMIHNKYVNLHIIWMKRYGSQYLI